LLRFLSVFGFLASLAVLLYARYVEPFRARIRHYTVQLPRAHGHLDGLRIAFVSDTHVGPHFSAADLEPVVESLERIRPDLVIFGGDYISESPRYIERTIDPLARMARTGRLGAYAVLGNHDVSNSRSRMTAALERAGITLMVNDAHRFDFGNGEFWIVGADDILLGRPDLAAAFADVPADAASIAVWHEPDWADRMAPYGPIVQLSGHTHGGQIRVPGKGEIALPRLGKRYPDGQYDIGEMTLLVSRGVGMYRPPMRFNCPPEVLLVHFVA
jgi:predicted MPP superfamily phosphohydrolase